MPTKTLPDGTITKTLQDGTIVITKKDKTFIEIHKDGTAKVTDPDGTITEYDKNEWAEAKKDYGIGAPSSPAPAATSAPGPQMKAEDAAKVREMGKDFCKVIGDNPSGDQALKDLTALLKKGSENPLKDLVPVPSVGNKGEDGINDYVLKQFLAAGAVQEDLNTRINTGVRTAAEAGKLNDLEDPLKAMSVAAGKELDQRDRWQQGIRDGDKPKPLTGEQEKASAILHEGDAMEVAQNIAKLEPGLGIDAQHPGPSSVQAAEIDPRTAPFFNMAAIVSRDLQSLPRIIGDSPLPEHCSDLLSLATHVSPAPIYAAAPAAAKSGVGAKGA